MRRRFTVWIVLAACVVAVDQATKWAITGVLRAGEVRAVLPNFNLVLTFNPGAAFSFLSDAAGWQRPLFIGVAILASVIITALLWRGRGKSVFCAGLALILGGALGNLWDRIDSGYVVDFLDFHAFGYHWPAFNAADSAITLGAALLILDGFRGGKERGG
ncbi:MAG: lipoprotein signal peptidase [Betaproteobacteria bacterium]|nr:lipoprotein signal peptidase [Betaproteobacteria bacterium]